jgi:hypothetical protein
MSRQTSEIVLDVDVRNPGQFFACCGVLEMALRMWPDSEVQGWFEGGEFLASVPGVNDPLGVLADRLVTTKPLVKLCPDAPRFEPNIAPVWFEPVKLRLDWAEVVNDCETPPRRIYCRASTAAHRAGGVGRRDWGDIEIATPLLRVDPEPIVGLTGRPHRHRDAPGRPRPA